MYVCFILSRTVEARSAELMGGTNIQILLSLKTELLTVLKYQHDKRPKRYRKGSSTTNMDLKDIPNEMSSNKQDWRSLFKLNIRENSYFKFNIMIVETDLKTISQFPLEQAKQCLSTYLKFGRDIGTDKSFLHPMICVKLFVYACAPWNTDTTFRARFLCYRQFQKVLLIYLFIYFPFYAGKCVLPRRQGPSLLVGVLSLKVSLVIIFFMTILFCF